MAVSYGTIAVVPKGTWGDTKEYNVGNLVEYDGSSYVAKSKPPVGTLPTNTNYWQVSATGTSKATATTTGVVKPDGVTTEVDSDAALSVKTATQNALGVVKGSDDITVADDGGLSVNTDFMQATELANIIANEALAVVLGKVSKAIAATMSLDQNALLKNMLTSIDGTSTEKVPTQAYIHTLVERIGMETELATGDNLTAALNQLNSDLDEKLPLQKSVSASADLTANVDASNNAFFRIQNGNNIKLLKVWDSDGHISIDQSANGGSSWNGAKILTNADIQIYNLITPVTNGSNIVTGTVPGLKVGKACLATVSTTTSNYILCAAATAENTIQVRFANNFSGSSNIRISVVFEP